MSASEDFTGHAETAPVIDFSKPNVARVYDALVGGHDNFEVDKAVLRRMLAVAPDIQALAKEHRQFLSRAVRYMAMSGIDQFLDLGSGLPTVENTHQIAQRHNPDSTVVYVDNDPVVQVHGRALLAENDSTHMVAADLTRPRELLAHPTVARCLDFERPMGLILAAVLHHVPDAEVVRRALAAYRGLLAPGSFVLISHQLDPADGGYVSRLAHQLERAFGPAGPWLYRDRATILSFFDGLRLLEPGLGYVHTWWPDGPRLGRVPEVNYTLLGGLARKS